MQPIRQVIVDAPNMIPIPWELRHKRLELIIWPLDDIDKTDLADSSSPVFRTMRVDRVVIPLREERYER
jgi:hypothetical protein